MNQYEVSLYLVDELPEIKDNIKTLSPSSLIKSIQCFTEFTKSKLLCHDLTIVRKCFITAENMYNKGDQTVKDIIENIFIYSFSTLLNLSNKDENAKVHGLVPVTLYTAYINQVLKSGI